MDDRTLDNIQWIRDLATATTELEDEIIVDNNSNIDLSCEYPYIVFNRDDLIRVMNLCSKIIQQKSNISSYNSISFITDTSRKSIQMYTTNELSYFRYTTELLGDMNETLNENFSISLSILQKLVKLMGNKILIYKKEENFYIRLSSGDLLLDTRPVDMTILTFPGQEQGKIADINLNIIGNITSMILPLLQSEIRTDCKRLYFTGEKAYFKSSFYYIEANIETPVMNLSIKDVEFINKLYKYYKNKQIQLFRVSSSLPRILLKINNIEYLFINSVNSDVNLMTQQMKDLITNIESTLEFSNFYKIVNLAIVLPDSTGNIELRYEDDKLITILSSVRGESKFSFNINKTQDFLYKDTVLIRAEILKRLLSSFIEADEIGIALSNKSINIKYKNVKAVIIHNK